MPAASWLIVIGVLGEAWGSSPGFASRLPDSVPSFLVDAAYTSVADLAYALAEARIPAGFILFEKDFEEEVVEHGGILWHRRSANDSRQVPLASVLATLRMRYPAYDVEDRAGVLLIRARAIGVVRLLDEVRFDRFRLDGEPLGIAFNEAQRTVDPTIPVRSGVVGSMLGGLDEPPTILAQPVHLDINNVTLLDELNEIVRAAPGSVWILSLHRNEGEYYTLAYRESGGTMARFHDRLLLQRERSRPAPGQRP